MPPSATPAGHAIRLDYHQRLLADPHRMVAYHRAIERLVKPGMVVLDAGAGTGVLAMMAARAGAAKVFAVESMPVAEVAVELVARNGLAHVVEVVRADLTTLPRLAEVDLVVSDCLGRFLVDDQMLDAMEAAFSWLAPGGVVAPARVELMVAPVAANHFELLDTFAHPLLGLDLSPLGDTLRRETWGGAFPAESVLARPQRLATWELPGPAPSLAGELAFERLSAGRLVGVAGWFRATLAPGVVLETAPGIETHWHQVLWPLSPRAVEPGQRLGFSLALESRDGGPMGEPRWRWRGEVSPPGVVSPPVSVPAGDGDALDEAGAAHFEAGEVALARACFEAAARAPGHRSPDQWDNLGIARFVAGDHAAAVVPLWRALDGDEASREQTLRLLVSACFSSGRVRDGQRLLGIYEAAFGEHPAGWRR